MLVANENVAICTDSGEGGAIEVAEGEESREAKRAYFMQQDSSRELEEL